MAFGRCVLVRLRSAQRVSANPSACDVVFVKDAPLKTTPWWWEDTPQPGATDNNLPTTTELAVIGAGFTGLSAALTAAERGAQVAVLDAQLPGHGASTRNGGMIGAPHRPGFVEELKT